MLVQVGEQDAEQPGQGLALSRGEGGQQSFLVTEEFIDAALDERVAVGGKRDVAQPAVRAGPLARDQALALGPGDSLGDRARH